MNPGRSARHPRVHPPWVLAGLLLVLLAVLLVVAGFADSQVGVIDAHARSQGRADQVPSSVLDGGAIVDATHNPTRSYLVPGHTVALSFDDGPDPTWTPEVLAVLRKYQVPGTFFVIGSMAARHPELIRQIHDAGSEIGLHTFTHPDLVEVSSWQFDRELAETQFTLAGSAGINTYLLRPPYSSTASALDNLSYRVVQAAGRRGYVTAFADVDSEDWRRPGVGEIVRNATPADGDGAVILMHDAGGDRSETVAALDRLIPRLLGMGYRFTTVTGAVGLPPANGPASTRDRVVGSMLLTMSQASLRVVTGIQWVMIGVGVLVILRLAVMVGIARRHAVRGRSRRRRSRAGPGPPSGPPVTDPVSVIVPAYNERENIEATLRSILRNDHPLEVIVVDDGSTDGTADIVARLALPRVRLIRQANGGKSSALNTGIAAARHDLVVMMDGDTVFEPDTVHRLVQPFADPDVGAVSGNVKIANKDTLLGRLQHIEYVIGFNVDRRVHDLLGSMPTIPGAAGAFRRQALIDVGGLSHDTLAEDTDLTIALGRAGWRAVYQDTAIAWTEAPGSLHQLWQQRYRWTYGTMQAVWKHRRAVLDRGASGRLGRYGLLHIAVFQMVLPLSAPVIDVFLIYGLFFLNPTTTLLSWSAVMALQLIGAGFAFRWDREPLGTLWVMPLQQLVYRQLMYVVLVQSLVTAMSGRRVGWQKLRRVGGLDVLLRSLPHAASTVTLLTPAVATAAAGGSGASPVITGGADHTGDGRSGGPLVPRSDRHAAPDHQADPADPPAAPESAPEHPAPEHEAPEHEAVVLALPRRGGGLGATPDGSARRDRWLAVLGTLALVDLIAYHYLGFGWLTLFPAAGVLFAACGSGLAATLAHAPMVDTIGRWLRWLLVPLWLMAAVLLPLMFWHGWAGETGDYALQRNTLALWLFPVLEPVGSSWAGDAITVLWFVRTCVWLVLLSPLLVRLLRRHPLLAMALPAAVVAGNQALGAPLANWGLVGPALLDAAVFAPCWLLGVAHRDGTLRRLHPLAALGAAAATALAGLYWTTTHVGFGADVSDVPVGQLLISAGVVLVLLRFAPRPAVLDRIPGLAAVTSVIGARVLTVYLWHDIAIDLSAPVSAALRWDTPQAQVGVVVALIVLAALVFGWAEDIGAHRPTPGQRAVRRVRRTVAAPAGHRQE